MSFKSITLKDLKEQFGIAIKQGFIFQNVEIAPVEPSEFLHKQLKIADRLPLRSEKAKSEFVVAPVLVEVQNITDRFITIYSGEVLQAAPDDGLVGECDFLLVKASDSYLLDMPILTVVEAKRENIEWGIQQCAAQLYGAFIYNQQNSNLELERLYGCVTTGREWQFLMLENRRTIWIDPNVYSMENLPKILGIFQHIIAYYRKRLE